MLLGVGFSLPGPPLRLWGLVLPLLEASRLRALLIAPSPAQLLLSSAAMVHFPAHPNNCFLPPLYCYHQDLPFLWCRKFLYPASSLTSILFFFVSTSLLFFVPACHSLLSLSSVTVFNPVLWLSPVSGTSPFLLFTCSRWRYSTTTINHENHWERRAERSNITTKWY